MIASWPWPRQRHGRQQLLRGDLTSDARRPVAAPASRNAGVTPPTLEANDPSSPRKIWPDFQRTYSSVVPSRDNRALTPGAFSISSRPAFVVRALHAMRELHGGPRSLSGQFRARPTSFVSSQFLSPLDRTATRVAQPISPLRCAFSWACYCLLLRGERRQARLSPAGWGLRATGKRRADEQGCRPASADPSAVRGRDRSTGNDLRSPIHVRYKRSEAWPDQPIACSYRSLRLPAVRLLRRAAARRIPVAQGRCSPLA